MTIKVTDFINPNEFKRTSEETFFLSASIKSKIVDSKIENPKERIFVYLIKSDSPNARIINALVKNIVSEWEDITCQ